MTNQIAFEMPTRRSTFAIPAARFPSFEAKMATLSKRSKRLLGRPVDFVVTGVREVEVRRGLEISDFLKDTVEIEKFIDVEIDTVEVRLPDWRLVARLDHSNDGGTLMLVSPTFEGDMPERFRTTKALCEHCNKVRARHDTFVVQHIDGTFKAVGSACLKDFLGHDAARMAAWMEIELAARNTNDLDEDDRVASGKRKTDLMTYLTKVAGVIRVHGWKAKSACGDNPTDATSYRAERQIYAARLEPKDRIIETDADRELAERSIAWGVSLTAKRNISDYEANLIAIAKSTAITDKSMGIAASMVSGFIRCRDAERAREIEAKQREALLASSNVNPYVGEVGERLKDIAATVAFSRSFGSDQFGRYTITKFVTAQGQTMTWMSSSTEPMTVGSAIKITGTVKKHSMYQGVEQTELSRCKIAAF